MAYTTFGTGAATIAKGMSYSPDWNAESNKVIALTQNMQNFFKVKGEQAKEWADMTVQAEGLGVADNEAYTKYLQEELFPMINQFESQNRDWRYNPSKYGIMKSMTDKIRNNDIVTRAASLKDQKKAFLEYAAKTEGYGDTQSFRDFNERLNFRENRGIDKYRQQYDEDDFVFAPPSRRDLDEFAEKLMANAYDMGIVTELVDGYVQISEVTTPWAMDDKSKEEAWNGLVSTLMNSRKPEWIEYYTDKQQTGTTKSDVQLAKEFLHSHSPASKKSLKDVKDPGQQAQAYATAAYYNQRPPTTRPDPRNLYADRMVNNRISDEFVTGALPHKEAYVKGKATGNNKFTGDHIIISGRTFTKQQIDKLGYKIYVPATATSTLIEKGSNSLIQFPAMLEKTIYNKDMVGEEKNRHEDARKRAEDAAALLRNTWGLMNTQVIEIGTLGEDGLSIGYMVRADVDEAGYIEDRKTFASSYNTFAGKDMPAASIYARSIEDLDDYGNPMGKTPVEMTRAEFIVSMRKKYPNEELIPESSFEWDKLAKDMKIILK